MDSGSRNTSGVRADVLKGRDILHQKICYENQMWGEIYEELGVPWMSHLAKSTASENALASFTNKFTAKKVAKAIRSDTANNRLSNKEEGMRTGTRRNLGDRPSWCSR